jgi:hypothetical protein
MRVCSEEKVSIINLSFRIRDIKTPPPHPLCRLRVSIVLLWLFTRPTPTPEPIFLHQGFSPILRAHPPIWAIAVRQLLPLLHISLSIGIPYSLHHNSFSKHRCPPPMMSPGNTHHHILIRPKRHSPLVVIILPATIFAPNAAVVQSCGEREKSVDGALVVETEIVGLPYAQCYRFIAVLLPLRKVGT